MTSEDLLAKLIVLHNCVERELHGVVKAVGDLDPEERPTPKLHSILTAARERIQTSLARQRMLLWKFSIESNRAAEHANSAGGEIGNLQKGCTTDGLEELPQQDCGMQTYAASASAPCRRWPQDRNNNDGDERAKVNEELEWKRDTLVRMQYLLQRRADDHTASDADRAALKRDILKITRALKQVQRETNDVRHKKRTCATTSTRSSDTPEEGNNYTKNGGEMGVEHSCTSERSTCRRDELARESATNTTTSSGGVTNRCKTSGCSGQGEQQERRDAEKTFSSAQSVQKIELQLPDGLDMLLERIAEGVRPPARPAASSELPSVFTSSYRGEQNNANGEDGSSSSNNGNTDISLPGVDRPNVGGAGAVQTKADPALSTLVVGMNDCIGAGCGNIQGTSRNSSSGEWGGAAGGNIISPVLRRGRAEARARGALYEVSMALAANHGPANTIQGNTEVVFREGLNGSSDKEN